MTLTFIQSRTSAATAITGMALILFAAALTINPIQAETGKGEDIFRVIMTVFGVDESAKGDVIAIVTASEAAKVKLFDASGPDVIPLNSSNAGGGSGGSLIEYVATFPNVTVNSGDEYKACVMTVKDLELICNTGQNSPASRPEFVDISLNATSNTPSDGIIDGESEREEEGEGD